MKTNKQETLTVGGGCFWCMEAIFNEVNGVGKVVSGYMGGSVPGHPTYREVCSGRTGHAEVVQMTFDPITVSLENLVVIFMTNHDPTILNGQGADIGTQYRSVIYFENKEQKEIMEEVLKRIAADYENPIVTEISSVRKFFRAEDYHQKYYINNSEQAYCKAVISPKLTRLRTICSEMLKRVEPVVN